MKANRKFVEGKEAVSAVIGVILMVAITVAIAATVYVYVSGMLGPGVGTTPTVGLSANPSGTICTITVGNPSKSDIKWSDVSYKLVNLSSGSSEGSATLPDTTFVTGGDVIRITGLTSGTQYQFSLVYDPTKGSMGIVTWTQP